MLLAHPAVLRDLVERYEALRALPADGRTPEVRRRLEDVTYTLCVSTGTRTPEAALVAAGRRMAASAVRPAPVAGRQDVIEAA
ncbi:DUF5133 domain-containing protein [Streptomyces sp. NBC_01465]|uniref:DUF5133 domain-containing protein n=1 Tax=Streptomyces sp. NBC_01465 TaxID=2903878 RepID=UPI002E32628A|nr:DUF5133 domain-containing protein [Streptomyces sp. NBC_01465]